MTESPPNDMTAQSTTNIHDTVATAADHIVSALTDTAAPGSDEAGLAIALEAARPRADNTTPGTTSLIATAHDINLIDEPVTVAIDLTRVEETNSTHSRVDEEAAYLTLSVVGTDRSLILAVADHPTATPAESPPETRDTLVGLVDDLLAHARDAVTIDQVVADSDLCSQRILEVFDHHNLSYIIQKPIRHTDWQIIHDLNNRADTTAAVCQFRQSNHETTALYTPLPTTTPTVADNNISTDAADRYRVLLTNLNVDPADSTAVLKEYLTRWVPIEIQAAVVRNALATPQIGSSWRAVPPLAAATAEYNFWQLTHHALSQHDSNEPALAFEDVQQLLDAHLSEANTGTN
ncbi:hypothetical protein [Halocalculus aciditolerans]|uniref:Transposase n=1 Tax=Halocalculus aciditolerans TaxID=1383812 RepID=A0A830F989_9EURY|nr:hypothetical protein [Halocalculus aciditolerans]GGL67055.1 hypothetical protein GCM10009039_26320 [Halocalculus aciditolerans]